MKVAYATTQAGRWFRVTVNVLKAFFDIRTDDTLVTKSGKVAATAARRVTFVILDYWVTFLLAGMVALMKYQGYTYGPIFLATWAFDFLIAATFYLIQTKSGQDITLGEAWRRAADVIHNENRIAGYLTFTLVTGKAIFWEGPEQIVIFFKISGAGKLFAALVFLSLVQGLLWAWLYSTAYDGVAFLIQA